MKDAANAIAKPVRRGIFFYGMLNGWQTAMTGTNRL
jgi:hypothetical protein